VNAQTKIDEHLLAKLSRQSGQCLDLANVLLATDEMLREAREANWGRVTDLEASRKKRLALCFAKPMLPENSQLFSEALAVMLHLNEELVSLLNQAKADVALQYREGKSAQTSIGHYLDVSEQTGGDDQGSNA
jgi:hypothetical protein